MSGQPDLFAPPAAGGSATARPLWLAGRLPDDGGGPRYAVFDDLAGSAIVAETGRGAAGRQLAVTIAAQAGAVTELRRALAIVRDDMADTAAITTFIENTCAILARMGETQ